MRTRIPGHCGSPARTRSRSQNWRRPNQAERKSVTEKKHRGERGRRAPGAWRSFMTIAQSRAHGQVKNLAVGRQASPQCLLVKASRQVGDLDTKFRA